MWFKARILFTEVMAAYACVRALLRRQMVYGVMVAPGDPQLMEGGGTCPICQARAAATWLRPSPSLPALLQCALACKSLFRIQERD